MKKLVLAAIAVLMVSSVFAEARKIKSASVFYSNEKVTEKIEENGFSADKKIKFNSIGLSYSSMGIWDSGLSSMFDIYAERTAAKDLYNDETGSGFGLKLGLGFAPLNTEKSVLAIHGFAGVDTKFLLGERPENSEEAYLMAFFNLISGADVRFAQKLGEKFGLYAGFDLYTNLCGKGFWTEDSDTKFTTKTGGLGIQPRIGFCWDF